MAYKFDIPQSIEIKYDTATVQNMMALLKAAPFPDKAPIDASSPWKLGIEYDYLKRLKIMFQTEWSWEKLEKKISRYNNFLVHYEHEGDVMDLHFVHAKSPRSDAIPLILLHGWPGTFFDFHRAIEPLINPPSSDMPAFHVVIPSLPGYFLSTLPRRDGWGLADIARAFNGLMISVLGYTQYVGQGGDWGAYILRVMGTLYPDSLVLMHFNMFRAPSAPGSDQSTYSDAEKTAVARKAELTATGAGYSLLQKTKPFTIGIAIASSPLAVLAYIGEKIYSWSDPERLDMQDILDTVALYYLSGCFATSVVIYNQPSIRWYTKSKERPELVVEPKESKWLLKNKFGYSAFPFEIVGSPRRDIAAFGPLVYYKEHTSGGHFPAMDSPSEYVEDLREFFGEYWPRK